MKRYAILVLVLCLVSVHGEAREHHRRGNLLRRVAAGSLAAFAATCIVAEPFQPRRPPPGPAPRDAAVVELIAMDLPQPVGLVAQHTALRYRQAGQSDWHRYEVWQKPGLGGARTRSWGHVYRDLRAADEGVGGGIPRVVQRWQGESATRLIASLERGAPSYRWKDRYFWTGPNCNTFTATMIAPEGGARLPGRAVGQSWTPGFGVSTREGKLKAWSPLGRLEAGNGQAQVKVMGLPLGLDVARPALLLPLGDGRIGFDR